MKLLVSAAEASSDMHGAELLKALRRQLPPGVALDAFGIGGPKLKDAGLKTVVEARELLSIGFTEIIGRLPRIIRAFRKLVKEVQHERPDVAVLMDYPDFHFRLAKKLKRLGIPVIYYIPPKVWIWRKGRTKLLRDLFKLVLCIFPFEEEFLRKEQVSAKYVGNPLVDELPLTLSREEARRQLSLGSKDHVLLLMPGSRPAEVGRHLELMLEAAKQSIPMLVKCGIIGPDERLQILLPFSQDAHKQYSIEYIKHAQKASCASQSIDLHILPGNSHACMVAADIGLIKSGTSTLEAGLLGNIHSVVYKPNKLSCWIVRNLVGYRGPVGLVNLVAGREKDSPYFIRELLCNEATVASLANEIVTLFSDNEVRAKIQIGLKELRSILIKPESQSPSEVAAKEILSEIFSVMCEHSEVYGNSVRNAKSPITDIKNGLKAICFLMGSALWSTASFVAFKLSRFKILKATRLPCRVISVGSIQAGGAGKTPLAAEIAKQANARNLKVAILTRGYRSKWEATGGIIAPGASCLASLCGDEAALLRELAPKAWIGVGADRIRQFSVIQEASGGIDIVILDDGFQHRKIHKDLEIVALTSAPRSKVLFRDWRSALRRADLVVWTKGQEKRRWWSVGGPLARVSMKVPKVAIHGQRIWLITGLAQPQFAREAIEEAGYKIEKHFVCEDHAVYEVDFARKVMADAGRAGCALAMSGKDWVKWRELGLVNSPAVLVLEPEIKFESGEATWSKVLWGAASIALN